MINNVQVVNKDFVKKFYGKAKIIEFNGVLYLKSYDTIVCAIDNDNFLKFWNDYSATTQKHINAFRALYGLNSIGKKDYLNMAVCPDSIPYQVTNVAMKYTVNLQY